MLHQTFSTTLAEQHRDELRRWAGEACLARDSRPNHRPRWHAIRRWWQPATRPTRA
jgi:hypothetical protein